MKSIKFSILLTFCVIACNQITSPDDNKLNASFIMTDTLGQSVSQLYSGESFYLSFYLTNTGKETLTYYSGSSAPPIIFRITKDDSIAASSIDGYDFTMVVSEGRLEPDRKLDSNWKAPTTPAQSPKVILQPGKYMALVFYPNFNEAKINKILPISFEVID
jgi:hypothetical protein